MNSYQLQQQREQRKEVKNYLNFQNIDYFEETGWEKFKEDYPQVLGEGGESLWSVGRKPHRPKTGSGDRLLDIPCKVNLSCNKLMLKKCSCKIFRIGARSFVAEIIIFFLSWSLDDNLTY